MDRHQAFSAEQATRRAEGQRPSCPQWHFWILRSGAPWRDLPECFGPYTTCYNRFVRWRTAGIWDCIMEALGSRKIVRLHAAGLMFWFTRKRLAGSYFFFRAAKRG